MPSVHLNGSLVMLDDALSVQQLLVKQGYDVASIAVAVNGEFIPKSAYENCKLEDGQMLEILSPMQGG